MVWMVNPVKLRRQVAASGTGDGPPKKPVLLPYRMGSAAAASPRFRPVTPKRNLSSFCFQWLAERRFGVEPTSTLLWRRQEGVRSRQFTCNPQHLSPVPTRSPVAVEESAARKPEVAARGLPGVGLRESGVGEGRSRGAGGNWGEMLRIAGKLAGPNSLLPPPQ